MQKSGLLKNSSSLQEEMGVRGSDSSDEEKRRSPKTGKRSRLNSMKSEKMKEKMQSSNSAIHKLELDVLDMLNYSMSHKSSISPKVGNSPTKELSVYRASSFKNLKIAAPPTEKKEIEEEKTPASPAR